MLIVPGGTPLVTLYNAIVSCGLTANLRLCLDAGDALSAPAGATKWLDRSGTGSDFWLGPDGTTTADPTFNGSVGALPQSTNFGLNGSSYFKLVNGQMTWTNNLHKAGAQWTILSIISLAGAGAQPIGDRGGTNAQVGMAIYADGGAALGAYVANGAAQVFGRASDSNLPNATPTFIASTIADGGTGYHWCNGSYMPAGGANTWPVAFVGPSSSASTKPFYLGCQDHNSGNKYLDPNGELMHGFAVWEGLTLTKPQLDAIFQRLRGRFGL